MTIIALADCCRRLAIDPKTLRRWLAQAQLIPQPHPGDARITGITGDQLRLLATAHHRSLPAVPGEFPAPAPAGHPQAPPPLPPELLALLQTLSTLPGQIAAMQQQLAGLTQRLDPPPRTAGPAHQGKARVRSRTSAPAPARSRPAKALPRPPAHVLPLVEYVQEGHYLVICPQHGLLPLEPDTPEWFTWLAALSSFRFVGKYGRLTAHREVQRVSGAPWRAHRKIRNHTYNLHLAQSDGLTSAVLEQAAAALQSHLQ